MSVMGDDLLDLDELARATGVTPRTIHYYLAQGLLPRMGPGGKGPRYTEGHVLRLRLIRALQDLRMSLGEILTYLRSLDTDDQVRDALARLPHTPPPGAPKEAGALAYVRSVLTGLHSPAPQSPRPVDAARSARHAAVEPPVLAAAPGSLFASPPPPPPAEAPRRATRWERIELAPYLEIHVRRPAGGPEEQRKVRALLDEARRLFGGEIDDCL
jgi:DNA-binding transcriptional MerR regulator